MSAPAVPSPAAVPRPGELGPIRGKRVLVTGASSGIGLAAARVLASRGAELILLGRNPNKTRAAADTVRAVAAAPVHLAFCDLASLADIRRAMGRLRADFDRLDVLLNNAGAMHTTRKTSADGIELTFAVDHLGYMLPTLALLPLLRAAPAARVVNVASHAHRNAKLDLDDLELAQAGYRGWTAYCNAKACNILFTRELARRLKAEGSRITANSLHPGVVRTGFARNDGGLMSMLWGLMGPVLRSPDAGADTSVHLCEAPELAGVSGQYFADCAAVRPRAFAEDDAAAAVLWRKSAAMLGLPAEGLPDPL